jgi:hypothetical protein
MKKDFEYLEFMWPMRHSLIRCGELFGGLNFIARVHWECPFGRAEKADCNIACGELI